MVIRKKYYTCHDVPQDVNSGGAEHVMQLDRLFPVSSGHFADFYDQRIDLFVN
jgi:hypothetical protein